MNPLSIGLGVVGLGLSIFGAIGASGKSKEIAEQDQKIAQAEQGINAQKQQQMLLDSQRKQLENIRNAQRLRAQATAAAVNQGANKGSGLQGGLAQISDQEDWNALGLDQNLQIGQNIFGLNNQISTAKIAKSRLTGEMATDQALMSLGGQLVGNSGTIGNFFKTA